MNPFVFIRVYSWFPIFFGLLLCALLSTARADPPPLEALHPAGMARGTTNTVTAIGKFSTWPVQAWISGDGIAVVAETNKGKLTFTVAADAPPGPRLVRLYNEEGSSEPRIFVVGSSPEALDTEPNNRFDQPQHIAALPITINGRLDKNGDVDSFAVPLRSGEWFVAHADCYTLLSKADTVLRLVTTNGLPLDWNHDFTALDPRLVWQSTNDTIVVLQYFGFAYPPGSEVALTGGDAVVYRLHLRVTNSAPVICEDPTETEPNDTPAQAEPIDLTNSQPTRRSAALDRVGDEDRFAIALDKDTVIEARVDAASFGSPLDAWLKIEDTNGTQLARNDDVDRSPDPRLEWKAPANGTYVIAVGSTLHRGGADHCYRLAVRKLAPDLSAVISQHSLTLKAGETNELKLQLKRQRGFTNELAVAIENLPTGVTLLTTNLSSKENDAVVIRVAAASDVPAYTGPVRVRLKSASAPLEFDRVIPFELTTSGETGYSRLLLETSDALWLTVRPRKPEAPATAAR